MKFITLRWSVFLFLPFVLLACEKSDGVQPDTLPDELDLSGLEIQFNLDFVYDFGYESPQSLNDLAADLLSELDEEENSNVQWVEFHIGARSTSLLFGDGKQTGYDKAKKGCGEEGWDLVGKGRYYSESCVRDRVETAFETKPGQGQCLDVRVDRGGIGVRVCNRLTDC